MAKGKGEIKGWFTRNGVHIPIYEKYTVREGHEPGETGIKARFTKKMSAESLKDKSVTTITDAMKKTKDRAERNKLLRNTFNLPNTTDAQLDTLARIFYGIEQHDKGYDTDKTPYNFLDVYVAELGVKTEEEKKSMAESLGKAYATTHSKPTLSVMIRTAPNDDRAIIRMMDEKMHDTLIGANGGTFKFNSNHKKVHNDWFDIAYGKHDGILSDSGKKKGRKKKEG